MTRRSGWSRFGMGCGLAALLGCLAPPAQAQPAPYTVDANTLHLWHLDETQNPYSTLPAFSTEEMVNSRDWDLAVTNGAQLAGPVFAPALVGSLDTRGIPGTGQRAGAFAFENYYLLDYELVGFDGGFTYEALVRPEFNPAVPLAGRTSPMEILSFDSNAGSIAERFFLFRLIPPASNEQWAVEFVNISSAEPGTNVLSLLDVVEDFSGDLSAYTETRVLDQGEAENVSFGISNGVLQTVSTGTTGAEQTVLLRDDVALAVGMEMQADVIADSLASSQDIGLMVGATATPTPLIYDPGTGGTQSTREDMVTVYVRNTAEVYTRGHNGTVEFPLAGGATAGAVPVARLFIARTASNTFETGWYDDAGTRTLLATRTVDNPAIGNAIGFYSDQRADAVLSGLDNLTRYTIELSVPPAETESFVAPLPTNGVDAAGLGNWYHVAVSYTGEADAPDNLTLYWTELSRGPAQASVLATFTMKNDLGSALTTGSALGNFAVGNENRGEPTENFVGFIDEARVSGMARAPSAFHLDGTPYAVDGDTLLLFHFDEPNPEDFPASVLNDAIDAVSADPVNLDVRNGATFGAPAYSAAFGTAMRVNGNGNDAAGAYADPGLAFARFADAATGAFTYEALVRPDFDPAGLNDHMQILSMEGDGGDRPFQWKFLERTNAAPLQLQFINISGGLQFLEAAVPTTGPHAIVAGKWYHAAVTYTGDPAQTNNFTFYWTALDSGVETANAILATNMTADIAGAAGDFVVGNEDRVGGGNTDALLGAIDEVRVSNVARPANRFLFSDLSFIVPEIRALAVSGDGTSVDLSWTSDTGSTYTISRSVDLPGGETGWVPVKSNIAGGDLTTSDSVAAGGGATEAYRIEVE